MKREIFTGLTEAQRKAGWVTVVGDFETYFDSALRYSLRTLTTEEYIRSEKFEVHAFSWARDDEPVRSAGLDKIADVLNDFNWEKVVFIAHNAMFDAAILNEHYGIRPARIIDTMALARLLWPNLDGGYSLGALVENFGIGVKARNVLTALEGLDAEYFQEKPEALEELLSYCKDDTELTRRLYRKLLETGRVDYVELSSIDAMVRASTEPVLVLDKGMVDAYKAQQEAAYEAVKHLGKDETLAAEYRALGVEPGTKQGKRGTMYAFAKSDDFMRACLDSQDLRVAQLTRDRFAAKSSSERGKAKRFEGIAQRGSLPVGVVPNGAHTGRDTGSGALNMQNVKRGSVLRDAVCAPEGYKLVKADFEQVECRKLAGSAGQENLLEDFRQKRDPYCRFGTQYVYGRTIQNIPEDRHERHVCKSAVLGNGFGQGGRGFQSYLARSGVEMDEAESTRIVKAYRAAYPQIVSFWHDLMDLVPQMMQFRNELLSVRVGTVDFRVGHETLVLPSGRWIRYPGLRETEGDYGVEYCYARLRGRNAVTEKLWHGKVVENVIQAMARDAMVEAQFRILQRVKKAAAMGLPAGRTRLVHRVHDELIFCVPDEAAEQMRMVVEQEMRRTVEWLPNTPMDTDAVIVQSWGDVK